jgi:TPR repeat protein
MGDHAFRGAFRGIALGIVVLAGALALPAAAFSADRPDDEGGAQIIWLDLAEHGDAEAQSALGFLYLIGLRVEQNDHRAAKWFQAAADQGMPDAQYYLGAMYLRGRGGPVDAVAAHFWCGLAISSGVADGLEAAYACRAQAARAMTREQIMITTRRAKAWAASPPGAASITKRTAR